MTDTRLQDLFEWLDEGVAPPASDDYDAPEAESGAGEADDAADDDRAPDDVVSLDDAEPESVDPELPDDLEATAVEDPTEGPADDLDVLDTDSDVDGSESGPMEAGGDGNAEGEPRGESGEVGSADTAEEEEAEADVDGDGDGSDADDGDTDADGSADDGRLSLEDFELDIDDLPDEDEDDTTDRTGNSSREVGAEWDDTREDRDDRIKDYEGDAPAEAVREYLRANGIAEEVRDRIDDLATWEDDRAVAEGDVLDMPNVTRALAGDTTEERLYRRRVTEEGDEIAVGVSLDMSGSMHGFEKEAKAAVGAFLFGVQQATNGEVVANGWHTGQGSVKSKIITEPFEDFEWRHLNSISPSGSTPTGRGVYDCGEMLDYAHAEEKLLIVITDGVPSAVLGRNEYERDLVKEPEKGDGVDEARIVVETLREKLDIAVVGFGFGDVDEGSMDTIFNSDDIDGDGFRMVELEDLADALVDVYQEQKPTHQKVMH